MDGGGRIAVDDRGDGWRWMGGGGCNGVDVRRWVDDSMDGWL